MIDRGADFRGADRPIFHIGGRGVGSADDWASFYARPSEHAAVAEGPVVAAGVGVGLLPRKNQSYSVSFKLKVLKAIDKDLLSLRDSCLKFNIPDAAIIVKWKKDFANFGLVGLQPKPEVGPKSMDINKRKKRKSDKPLTREEELLLENEALRCENELLKKLQALIQAEEKARKRKP